MRDKINAVLPQLPKGIDPPIVSKVDPDAAPVLLVALQVEASRSARSPRSPTSSVRRQIESISGVGQVNLVGGRKRQINVWLDPRRAARAGPHRGRRAARDRARRT